MSDPVLICMLGDVYIVLSSYIQMEYSNGMVMYRIDDGPGFPSIDQLLRHYKQDSDRLPCRLTEFCPRPPTRMTEC